jgi:hypothetical protein
MIAYDKFRYIVEKLSPFELEEYVPRFPANSISDLLLIYEQYFYDDNNWNELKDKYFTSYIEKATKSFFALGLYECLQRIPSNLTNEQLNNFVRYLMKHNVWIEAFKDQDIEEEVPVERIIEEFQRIFTNLFFYELKENNYLSIYLRQYYYVGWNFGNKIIMGL